MGEGDAKMGVGGAKMGVGGAKRCREGESAKTRAGERGGSA